MAVDGHMTVRVVAVVVGTGHRKMLYYNITGVYDPGF
jgi:hypothetical protein